MKIPKAILVFLVIILSAKVSFAQDITADTTRANAYYAIADSCLEARQLDSALFYTEKVQNLYINHLGKNSLKNANCLHMIGAVNYYASKYNEALEFYFKSLDIKLDVLGEKHASVASTYNGIGIVYWKMFEFDKALEYYFKSLKMYKEIYGENHPSVASLYNNIGLIYANKFEYDKALEYYFNSLKINLKNHDKNHTSVASSYYNIGLIYSDKSEYDKALEYYFNGLEIRLEILGKKHPHVAHSYGNIGNVYLNKSEYNKALEYYFKSLQIFKEIYGNKHPYVGDTYSNIGIVYHQKSEYDKALEYHFKSLKMYKEINGENHPSVARSYINIGLIYANKTEYSKALDFFLKSLKIDKEIFGEKHPSVASSYSNIGIVYANKSDYDKALEYHFKSLDIRLEVQGEVHSSVANSYNNIGSVYHKKSEYNNALEYYFKNLKIDLEIHGEKHLDVAGSYNNIGNVYRNKSKYDKALEYYQKGAASCLPNFNDTANVASVPEISDYLDWNELLKSLQAKARIFAYEAQTLQDFENPQHLALLHYQACDTIISRARQEIVTQSDKLALGEHANEVYKEAVDVCLKLADAAKARGDMALQNKYKQTAFYFSERNKSSVLLQALAGSEALRFAGIPDSLLQKEHDLSINMAFYKRILAEQPDSAKESLFRDKLFEANQEYDKLIATLETQYPDYYELKYNEEPAGVEEIQEILDPETAMISYFTGDSTVTIFCITKNDLDVKTVSAIQNFADTIEYYRSGLIYTTSSTFAEIYKKYAYKFYNKFIPSQIDKRFQDLILIPDAELSMIPFETLLTGQAAEKEWKDLPYLIKQYNISYSYSGNLFYQTFSKESSKEIEVSDLNDWLALAPVFDDSNTAGLTMRTRELLREFDAELKDTIGTRGRLLDGEYISSLPGTESEVRSIFDELDRQGKRALVQIRKKANEDFVKSGSVKDYKFLHFATHGFVNTEKPELSGIFLAQDSTLNEDGILYQGEIYNLDLNADLIVLSACETGLGKIKKGEGLIGLTRALLYAGSKNIIVSLWKVADNSTSDLMVDFYKNLLEEELEKQAFSHALQKAKLKMIEEGKYAHPFYWSPFILIGK
ncbi:MAG: tetratricopeptide repeat protein [Bacteroidota bacterium]|nr:tetratricopeptide repeat protein [Bacteroidota bacterium]